MRIINELKSYKNLSAHCKSKKDDVGAQMIQSGKEFEFSFRPNFWGTTLYFCKMQWENSSPRYFDIYIGQRDRPICSLCLWKISETGPCLFNYETAKFDVCYNWNVD